MKLDKKSMLLYAVTDSSWLRGKTLCERVREALDGGVTFVQLREKNIEREAFLNEARDIKELCKEYNVPFVINDNVDIAIACDADGVHVGQGDMGPNIVREKLGKDKIIGVSVQTVEEAIIAQNNGADYLGVGAVFETLTKLDANWISYKTLREICKAVSIPVVAIGGINSKNILELSGSGANGVAIISGIFAQDDITSATKELKRKAEIMVNI